jgi:hypothetical protein
MTSVNKENNNIQPSEPCAHVESFLMGSNYNVKIEYYYYSKYKVERKAKLMINNACWGELTITGDPFNCGFEEPMNTISIWIDRPYQKLGFSRILIKSIITEMYKREKGVQDHHKLFIDTDITHGFWTYVGTHHILDGKSNNNITFTTIRNLDRFS